MIALVFIGGLGVGWVIYALFTPANQCQWCGLTDEMYRQLEERHRIVYDAYIKALRENSRLRIERRSEAYLMEKPLGMTH